MIGLPMTTLTIGVSLRFPNLRLNRRHLLISQALHVDAFATPNSIMAFPQVSHTFSSMISVIVILHTSTLNSQAATSSRSQLESKIVALTRHDQASFYMCMYTAKAGQYRIV